MIKLLFSFLFVFVSFLGISQENPYLLNIDTTNSIRFHNEIYFHSNFISNNLLQKIYNGERISKENISQLEKKLTHRNSLGGYTSTGLSSTFHLTKSNYSFLVGINDRLELNTDLGSDLLKLAAFGNKKIEGNQTIINNSIVNFYRFQEFKLGFFRHGKTTIGVIGNFLNGEFLASGKIKEMHLNTSEYGSAIGYDVNAKASISDTNNIGAFKHNGTGFSLQGLLSRKINSNVTVELQFGDIGIIKWNEQTINYNINHNFSFTGVFIENLKQPNDSSIKAQQPDTIFDYLLNQNKFGTKNTILSPTLFFSTFWKQNNKLNSRFSIHQKFNGNYTPRIQIQETYSIYKFISLSAIIGYGGYGNFGSGLGMNFNNERFNFQIKSANLNSLLFSENQSGITLWFNSSYSF